MHASNDAVLWRHHGKAVCTFALINGFSLSLSFLSRAWRKPVGQSTPTQPKCPAFISPILFKTGEWMKRGEKNNPPKYKFFLMNSFVAIVILKSNFSDLP